MSVIWLSFFVAT